LFLHSDRFSIIATASPFIRYNLLLPPFNSFTTYSTLFHSLTRSNNALLYYHYVGVHPRAFPRISASRNRVSDFFSFLSYSMLTSFRSSSSLTATSYSPALETRAILRRNGASCPIRKKKTPTKAEAAASKKKKDAAAAAAAKKKKDEAAVAAAKKKKTTKHKTTKKKTKAARDLELQARARIPSHFYADAVKAIAAYGPSSTKTMMHSGVGAGNAFKIAKAKGLQTVETTIFMSIAKDKAGVYTDTLKKYCVTKETYCAGSDNTESEWVEAWTQISKAWAEYAECQTTLATTKAGPDSKSFYKKVEEPILKKAGVDIDTVVK
jgi:hypothetical protein